MANQEHAALVAQIESIKQFMTNSGKSFAPKQVATTRAYLCHRLDQTLALLALAAAPAQETGEPQRVPAEQAKRDEWFCEDCKYAVWARNKPSDHPIRSAGECPVCGGRSWAPLHGLVASAPPAVLPEPVDGATLIASERRRQVSAEGWSTEHDDQHDDCELAQAARAYVWAARQTSIPLENERLPLNQPTSARNPWNGHPLERGSYDWPVSRWPWDASWWKPSDDPVRNLVKAGALIAAEIDRLLRRVSPQAGGQP